MKRKDFYNIHVEISRISSVITDFFFKEMYQYNNEVKQIGGYHFCLDEIAKIAIKLEKQTRNISLEDWEAELERLDDTSWEDYIARLAEDELRQQDLLKPKFYSVWAEDGYLNSGLNSTNKKDLKESILSYIQSDTERKDFNAFKKMDIKQICDIKGWSLDVNDQRIPEGDDLF